MANDGVDVDLERLRLLIYSCDHRVRPSALDDILTECTEPLASLSPSTVQHRLFVVFRAAALLLRFETDGHGNRDDIDQAKHALEALLRSHTALTPFVRGYAMYWLGRTFEALYDAEALPDALELAHTNYQQALQQISDCPGHDDLTSEISVHLGRMIVHTIADRDAPGDVSDAVSLIAGVVRRTDPSDPLQAFALACLSVAHRRRFSRTRLDKADLERSYDCARQALLLAPWHRYRYRFLAWFSIACRTRFTFGDSIDFIREAIEAGEEAAEIIRASGRSSYFDLCVLGDLGNTFTSAFRAEGRIEDLDSAVTYHRLAATDAPYVLPTFYSNYCDSLGNRFRATGRLLDIDEAIAAGQKALDRTPLDDTGSLAYVCESLGQAFAMRFTQGGERGDYRTAKQHLEEAIQHARGNGAPYMMLLAGCLQALAGLHSVLFKIDANAADLDLAVEHMSASVTYLTEGHADMPTFLSELGGYLSKRFQQSGAPEDLSESIRSHRRALKLAPSNQCDRHLMLGRYGRSLRLQFEVDHSHESFEQGVEALKDAIARSRAMHSPRQSGYETELANLHLARFQVFNQAADLEDALTHYIDAATTTEGFVDDRFNAAVLGARSAQEHGRLAEANEAFSIAVSLLPRIAWVGLNVGGRHSKLASTAAHLACDAAASAIMFGQLERAVELLDEGRSVLWRSVLELRTDVTDLQKAAPDLAAELLTVGQALEREDLASGELSEKHAEELSQRRRRTAERWEMLIERVRKLEGFESFLRPLPYSKLRDAAQDGAVVLLNISRYRCDALIIRKTEPVRCVPISGLDLTTVRRLTYNLSQALHVARDMEGCCFLERTLLDVARRLWTGGLSDVATALMHCKGQTAGRPLRVWWVPTGFLSLLPVHCAGPVNGRSEGIADLFISSYTTSLSALLQVDTPSSRSASPTKHRVLAVTQPTAPDMPLLPCTDLEMQVLRDSPFGNVTSFLDGPDATLDAVTSALPQYRWIHLSCHGRWNAKSPLESAFHFKDGRLTLARIVQMRLNNAEFAYLSACHTARHTIVLPDESMHLAAGLQVAGIGTVLATAWGMADRDGPILAHYFYRWLQMSGQGNIRNAAEALHYAVGVLRESGTPLYRWAAFVHYGR